MIDHLVEIHGSNTTSFPVAYFYCNFDDHKTLQPANVLATLLKQIVATRPSMPEAITAAFKMQQLHGMVSGKHSFEDVKSYFSEVLKSTEIRTAFLLLDGVDECPSTPKGQGRSLDSRGQLLNALVELTALQLGNSRIKVLVSSRLDSDIQFILKPFPDIAVEQSDTRDDITEYVGSQLTRYIQEGMPVRRPIDDHPELRALIIDSLIEKSQGM